MTDTDSQTAAHYRRLLMARTTEERFLMGVQMCEAARATVLASLPADQNPIERKIALLRRYYGNDFDDAQLAKIEAAFRERTVPVAIAAGS